MVAGSRGSSTSWAVTLTATGSVSPARRHAAACSVAWRSTHSVTSGISAVPSSAGEEPRRAEEAELGVVPAQQRLDADDGAVGQRHLRLVVDAELVLLERAAQVLAGVLPAAPARRGPPRAAGAPRARSSCRRAWRRTAPVGRGDQGRRRWRVPGPAIATPMDTVTGRRSPSGSWTSSVSTAWRSRSASAWTVRCPCRRAPPRAPRRRSGRARRRRGSARAGSGRRCAARGRRSGGRSGR